MTANRDVASKVPLVFSVFILLLLISSLCVGQMVNARLTSSVYGWKQYDTVGTAKKLWRGYSSLVVDIGKGEFSLHGHFQGAVMLQRKLDELPDYRLYYGYAKWKNIADIADISLGRLPFFSGVGSGTLDGALTTLHTTDNKLRVTMYGGANVPLDLSVLSVGPIKNNFTLGGQILTTAVPDWRFGLSYMNRQRRRPGYWTVRPDTIFTLTTMFVDPLQTREQYVSGDVSYWLPNASLHARYDFNVDYKQTQRAQVNLKYYPSEPWAVSADFIHRAPRLPFNSFFSVFNIQASDEMEGGVDYTFAGTTRAFIRAACVQYVSDKSFRYTVGIANDFASASYRGGNGYAGELDAVSLQGSYPLLDRMIIPNLGISYSSYKLTKADKQEKTIASVLGIVARPMQMLTIDVQGQWLNNKVYRNDLRLYAAVSFWISELVN